MLELPKGAAETDVIDFDLLISTNECQGKKGARCSATAIGPIPGPPPP